VRMRRFIPVSRPIPVFPPRCDAKCGKGASTEKEIVHVVGIM